MIGPIHFIQNKYFRWYSQIINRALDRGVIPDSEKHHSYPEAFGGTRSCLVYLTYREHYLCHWLLVKFTTGKAKMKMSYGLLAMTAKSKLHTRNTASWQYAIARKSAKGFKHSEESRRKMSENLKGHVAHNKGKRMSEEQKVKLRGIKRTPETRKLLSESKKKTHTTSEFRARSSKAANERWSDPEQRQLMSQKTKAYFDGIAKYRTFNCLSCDKEHVVRANSKGNKRKFCDFSCSMTFTQKKLKEAA